MGKVSWQLEAKEYHEVTPHYTSHTKDLLGGKSPGVCYLWMRSSRELSKRQDFSRVSWGAELSRVAWNWKDYVALSWGKMGNWWDFFL